MARTGVTQEAVNAAADQLLHAGERPTIERVRAVLGTGSPNTLIRLLDIWWANLGQRLQACAAKLALPEAPAPVVALAGALWEQALEAAQTLAAQTQAEAREQIARDRAALDRERLEFRETAEGLTAQALAARHAESLADTRSADARQLIEQQAVQLGDVGLQRDAALQRVERLERDLAELHTRLYSQEEAAGAERKHHTPYVESVENRAGIEIDRARQEARLARQELATAQKEHSRLLSVVQGQRDEAVAALAAAQQDATAQRARAETFEHQQNQWAELTATVRGALVRAGTRKASTGARKTSSSATRADNRATRSASKRRQDRQ